MRLINLGDWDGALLALKNKEDTLVDGCNNIFHLACARADTTAVGKIIAASELGANIDISAPNCHGEPGLHLYYKYGGDSISFLTERSVCQLDKNGVSILSYITGNINALEKAVNTISDYDCTDMLNILEGGSLASMLSMSEADGDNRDRYLRIALRIFHISNRRQTMFDAIALGCCRFVSKVLDKGFELIFGPDTLSPLSWSIVNKCKKMSEIIISHISNFPPDKRFDTVNFCSDHNSRPIILCLQTSQIRLADLTIDLMKEHLKTESDAGRQYLLSSKTTNNLESYLHLAARLYHNKHRLSQKSVELLINHTDLDRTDYAGYSSAHRMFKTNMWVDFISSIRGRYVDLEVRDPENKNCYDYAKAGKVSETLEDLKGELLKTTASVQVVKPGGTDGSTGNYGLFGYTFAHSVLYIEYIRRTYKNLYVPVIPFNAEDMRSECNLCKIASFPTCVASAIMESYVRNMIKTFYTHHTFWLSWVDSTRYFLSDKHKELLIKHDKNVPIETQRYTLLSITIVQSMSLHINCVIYDRREKTLWLFEPYGYEDLTGVNDFVINYYTSIYGKIKYRPPESFLGGSKFQSADDVTELRQNIGDPSGYCLAWAIWFLEIVLSNPDTDVEELMRGSLERENVSALVSFEEGETVSSVNHYLDFIRRYARKLDAEKNKILLEAGVKRHNMHGSVLVGETCNKIVRYFQNLNYDV